MMKNNILLLIIDSLNYSRVMNASYETMPFLKSLEKDCVYCTSMYSEAPYTEAASMNLYCGQDTLDYNGYIFRYKNSPKTIFEIMKDAGYCTYYNSYQPQCHPSSVTRGIDELFYNVGFDLEALWSYRLSHYANLKANNELNERDYECLRCLLDDNFESWFKFVNDYIDDDKKCELIKNNSGSYKSALVISKLGCEFAKYTENKNKYINDVLEKGTSHELFKIQSYNQDCKLKNREIVKQTKKIFKKTFKKIRRKNMRLNLRNNKGIFKGARQKLWEFLKKPSKLSFKNYLKSMYISFNLIFDLDLYKRISKDYDSFKNAPSIYKHFDHFFEWSKSRTDNKPFFGCIHVDDVHNPETFFTYDTEDLNILNKQKNDVEEFLKTLPKDYKGVISHDLSLMYIDNAIKDMFKMLKENNLLENTTVLITADHGFSFGGYPIRNSFVINTYLENYQIPFYVYNSGKKASEVTKLCRSTDIPATIVDLAGVQKCDNFSGISIFEKKEHDCCIIEFCGGGCPDLSRREIISAVFDKKTFASVKYKLDDTVSIDSFSEIYDLEKDKLQLHNLTSKNEVSKEKLTNFVKVINDRKNKIKKEII